MIKLVCGGVDSVFRCLQSAENADPHFHLEYRGPVPMKGKKEPMKVWFLSRTSNDSESSSVKA